MDGMSVMNWWDPLLEFFCTIMKQMCQQLSVFFFTPYSGTFCFLPKSLSVHIVVVCGIIFKLIKSTIPQVQYLWQNRVQFLTQLSLSSSCFHWLVCEIVAQIHHSIQCTDSTVFVQESQKSLLCINQTHASYCIRYRYFVLAWYKISHVISKM